MFEKLKSYALYILGGVSVIAIFIASFYKRRASDLSVDLEVKDRDNRISNLKDEINKDEAEYEKELEEYKRNKSNNSSNNE